MFGVYISFFLRVLHLLCLIFYLQFLRCIHNLWKDQIACNLSEELESAKMLMIGEEGFEQNETGELLEEIRERG